MEALLLGMLNTPEIIALLVLALILFGAKKLPELAKGLGHGIKEFRKASREISDELNSAIHEEPSTPSRRDAPPSSLPSQPEGTQPQQEESTSRMAAADDSSGGGSTPSSDGGESEAKPPTREA